MSSTPRRANNNDPPASSSSPLRNAQPEASNASATETAAEKSSFVLLKSLTDSTLALDTPHSDDETVQNENTHAKLNSQRMTIMFQVPKLDEESTGDNSALAAIEQMNSMIKTLVNKLPKVRVGPWASTPLTITKKELLKKLPLKVDIVENYVYDYTRHISAGARGYCRLQLFFPSTINVNMITHITSTFKKPRVQFFERSKSDALFPVTLCTLTGSVEAMTTSPDFFNLFKSMFELKHLGLWWSIARTQARGGTDYARSKFVLHVEIDSTDLIKAEKLKITSATLLKR